MLANAGVVQCHMLVHACHSAPLPGKVIFAYRESDRAYDAIVWNHDVPKRTRVTPPVAKETDSKSYRKCPPNLLFEGCKPPKKTLNLGSSGTRPKSLPGSVGAQSPIATGTASLSWCHDPARHNFRGRAMAFGIIQRTYTSNFFGSESCARLIMQSTLICKSFRHCSLLSIKCSAQIIGVR